MGREIVTPCQIEEVSLHGREEVRKPEAAVDIKGRGRSAGLIGVSVNDDNTAVKRSRVISKKPVINLHNNRVISSLPLPEPPNISFPYSPHRKRLQPGRPVLPQAISRLSIPAAFPSNYFRISSIDSSMVTTFNFGSNLLSTYLV